MSDWKDRLCSWLAFYLPKRLRYFTVIDALAKYTQAHPDAAVPEVTVMEVTKFLESKS